MTCLRVIAFAGALVLTGAVVVARAAPAEICHDLGSGQYADNTRVCVSSVLAPQGRNSYGPDQLYGESKGAWCEGVAGPGIGQSITLHTAPKAVMGSLLFGNGYAKTPELFRANGRIKDARIETDAGYSKTITLKDTSEDQVIPISTHHVTWARLTILSVYPGTRGSDTCISGIMFNYEGFLVGYRDDEEIPKAACQEFNVDGTCR